MPEADQIRRRVQARLVEQHALVRSLLELREQLKGSLFVRYGRCGKPNCACRGGPGHGPYYVLSRRRQGQGAFAYLAGPRLAEARHLLGHGQRFRAGMRRLRRLNLELVGLLRRYQSAADRRAAQRLAVTRPAR